MWLELPLSCEISVIKYAFSVLKPDRSSQYFAAVCMFVHAINQNEAF